MNSPKRRRLSMALSGLVLIGALSMPLAPIQADPQSRHAVYVQSTKKQSAKAQTRQAEPEVLPPPTVDVPHRYPFSEGYHPVLDWLGVSPGMVAGYGGVPFRLRQWGPDSPVFAVPGRGHGGWIDDDYRQYRYWKAVRDDRARTRSLLGTHDTMMKRGLAAFAHGNYAMARSAFRLAAKANVFDPACRVHLAHACFALGRYAEAARNLRDAFHLEPRLADLPFDVRDDYGRAEDFAHHLAALEKAATAAAGPEVLIVLGYVQYFTAERGEAYMALNQALKMLDERAAKERHLLGVLIEGCRPSRFVRGAEEE